MPDSFDHDRDHAFAQVLAGDRALHGRIYPLKRDVAAFADALLGILFPQLSDDALAAPDDLAARLVLMRRDLRRLVAPLTGTDKVDEVVTAFADALPRVHAALLEDGEAILAGDPAAESLDEVVAAYPGFLAIAIHRVAHELYVLGVPILPRLLAEVAHTRTGVDIHPGATIGHGFCIDHGTGVVVGETAVIGDRVKLYQGVTLGALSVVKDLAGQKRHPTIGDRVVIYANATVLGGDTVVGNDTIIGGNVFVTSSVAAGSVLYQTSRSRVRRADDGFDDIDFVI
ncbi:MAG TPA: serine O-acetyltransferase [Candidatus Limnocylindrales bacterium]